MLFESTKIGSLILQNRVVMAPMTRCRALGNTPNAMMAEYYGARADAGLLISEGTSPAPEGLGYARIPGAFTQEQAAGWGAIASAVHARGGKFFVQLMHTGRVGHPANLPAGATLRGPSAIAAPGQMWTDSEGMQPHPTPKAMTAAEIEEALEGFAAAAKLLVAAGVDGVELHGANGYLIEQFLNTASNVRDDAWGGTVEGRARFLIEAARRCAAAVGAGRVGVRLSPYGVFGGMVNDADTDALYAHVASQLSELGVVYVHLVDHSAQGAPPVPEAIKAMFRQRFAGAILLCGGYDAARAEADLQAGKGDLVAFGRPFLGNPDLVDKLQRGEALQGFDFGLAYMPGAKGYTEL